MARHLPGYSHGLPAKIYALISKCRFDPTRLKQPLSANFGGCIEPRFLYL